MHSTFLLFLKMSLYKIIWEIWERALYPNKTSRMFTFLTIKHIYSDHSPDFCREMWLRKSCGPRPQENMAASGREYGFLWLQRCCCLRQQPTLAASGRKSKGSSQWATQKYGQLTLNRDAGINLLERGILPSTQFQVFMGRFGQKWSLSAIV